MTTFEKLSNELLFEIFDYLSFNDIFHAFFDLQKRFDELIRGYPTSIRLTKGSNQSLLANGPFQCRSLAVENISLQCSEKINSYFTFESTKSVEFSRIDCTTVLSIFNQVSMEQLESIIIRSLDREFVTSDILRQIWSIIAVAGSNQLRYLDVSLQTIHEDDVQLSSDLPSLEWAALDKVSDQEMFVFLQHTPNLSSFTARINDFCSDVDLSDLNILKLTHLNLRLDNHGSFEALYVFLSRCSNLIDFEFQCWSTKVDGEMVNLDNWQNLIEEFLVELLYLTIRFYRYTSIETNDTISDQFENSDYWRKRQPDFSITVRISERKYAGHCFCSSSNEFSQRIR